MLFLAALLAATAIASPTRVERLPADLVVRSPPGAPVSDRINKRDTSVDFSLDHAFQNQTLYHGKTGATYGNVDLDVECLDCRTAGTVTATLTDHEIIKPRLRVDFKGVSAYAEMQVTAKGTLTFPINLFTSESPVGVGITGFDVGLMFFVDLVFSLSDSLTFEGGFTVTLPDDASVEVDIFDGGITNQNFVGTSTNSLPITVSVGDAKLTADLRLRVQAGVEAKGPFKIGGGAILALYANIAEFVAEQTSYGNCTIGAEEWFDINVGAFASAGATLDIVSMSEAPTVSTTFFSSPTLTQCLDHKARALVTSAPIAPPVPS